MMGFRELWRSTDGEKPGDAGIRGKDSTVVGQVDTTTGDEVK